MVKLTLKHNPRISLTHWNIDLYVPMRFFLKSWLTLTLQIKFSYNKSWISEAVKVRIVNRCDLFYGQKI